MHRQLHARQTIIKLNVIVHQEWREILTQSAVQSTLDVDQTRSAKLTRHVKVVSVSTHAHTLKSHVEEEHNVRLSIIQLFAVAQLDGQEIPILYATSMSA